LKQFNLCKTFLPDLFFDVVYFKGSVKILIFKNPSLM
jgi:hypothetical protein